MKKNFNIWLQQILPQHLLSRLAGLIAQCCIRSIKNSLIKIFIRHYNINLQEALITDFDGYPDFNSFFTRALKPEARPVDKTTAGIACPVDGCISQIGVAVADTMLQAKNHDFFLQQLIGEQQIAESFYNGNYATLYLSPKDYHRVHMPLSGKLTKMIYIPGHLFSVNNNTCDKVANLYARNERIIAIFETDIGKMAMVLVGALMVGSIETVWSGVVIPNKLNKIKIWHYEQQNISLQKGQELGRFKFGSTVILLFQEKVIAWNNNLAIGMPVKMGQKLGNCNK